jgi:flagellar hook assembly protein FlgD
LFQNLNVKITVFDLLGNSIKNLINREQSIGIKSILWDGTNNQGILAPAGIYIYKIQAGNYHQSKKMILMK